MMRMKEKYFKSTARGLTLAYTKTISNNWDDCEIILATGKNDVIGLNADKNIVQLKYDKNNHDNFVKLWEVTGWLFEISEDEFKEDFKSYVEGILAVKSLGGVTNTA